MRRIKVLECKKVSLSTFFLKEVFLLVVNILQYMKMSKKKRKQSNGDYLTNFWTLFCCQNSSMGQLHLCLVGKKVPQKTKRAQNCGKKSFAGKISPQKTSNSAFSAIFNYFKTSNKMTVPIIMNFFFNIQKVLYPFPCSRRSSYPK